MSTRILKKVYIPSIMASLIVIYVIQPAINLGGTSLSIWRSDFRAKFTDSMYENAALGMRNWVDVLFFNIFIGVLAGVVFGISLAGALIILKSTKMPSIFSKIKSSRIVKRVIIAIYILSGVYLVISSYSLYKIVLADLQLNASFQQRMACLAPYISEQEEKKMFAMWANMTNKHDFEVIERSMEGYAQEANIKLPKKLKF